MDAATIRARMDTLYKQDWVNFNLFVPETLMVSGMKNKWVEGTGGGQDLLDIISDMSDTSPLSSGTGIRSDLQESLLAQLQTVEGIEFRELPLERSNTYTLSAGKQDTSTQTIKIKFLLDKDMSIMAFLDAWRDMLYTDELIVGGSSATDAVPVFKNVLRSKTEDTLGNGEGYLVMSYISLDRRGNITPIGKLKIAGLIPKKINFGGKVGPGLDAQSSLPTVEVECIYSMGYLTVSGRKVWLK